MPPTKPERRRTGFQPVSEPLRGCKRFGGQNPMAEQPEQTYVHRFSGQAGSLSCHSVPASNAKDATQRTMNAVPNPETPLRPSRSLREARRTQKRELWAQALSQRSVWLRACKLGLSAGLLQAAVNQGDRWINHTVDSTVIIKSIVSPLIGFALVLFSAAQTWVQRTLETTNSPL